MRKEVPGAAFCPYGFHIRHVLQSFIVYVFPTQLHTRHSQFRHVALSAIPDSNLTSAAGDVYPPGIANAEG